MVTVVGVFEGVGGCGVCSLSVIVSICVFAVPWISPLFFLCVCAASFFLLLGFPYIITLMCGGVRLLYVSFLCYLFWFSCIVVVVDLVVFVVAPSTVAFASTAGATPTASFTTTPA